MAANSLTTVILPKVECSNVPNFFLLDPQKNALLPKVLKDETSSFTVFDSTRPWEAKIFVRYKYFRLPKQIFTRKILCRLSRAEVVTIQIQARKEYSYEFKTSFTTFKNQVILLQNLTGLFAKSFRFVAPLAVIVELSKEPSNVISFRQFISTFDLFFEPRQPKSEKNDIFNYYSFELATPVTEKLKELLKDAPRFRLG